MARIESHSPGRVCHIDLVAKHLPAAKAFYGGLLGWTFPDADDGYAIALLGGDPVAAIGEHPEEGERPKWHVYFASEDVDADTARAEALGAERVEGPASYEGMGRMVVLRDPSGVTFSLWQAQGFIGACRIGEPGALSWQEIHTRDAEATRVFYSSMLHATTHESPDGRPYWTLNHGGESSAGILQMNDEWPAEVEPHWMVYFAVPDVDAACTRVTELGGAVRVPPFDTPPGRTAVVNDPGGAVFSVIALNEPAR